MEIPDELIVKARPFFLNYFNKLANDLNTLTAAPVSCSLGDISLLQGTADIESVFETDRCLARVQEDGTNSGDIHIIFDVTTSIALTGLMMMMGEGIIEEQINKREYSDEIHEGFHEVANQVVGAMNELVERKFKGGHLYLDNAEHIQYGELPESLSHTAVYLSASVEIQVSHFAPQPARWILATGVAAGLLGIAIPLDGEEEGAGVAAKPLVPPGPAKKGGVDLSAYAGGGQGPGGDSGVDLSGYAGGEAPGGPGLPDLSAYAGGEEPGGPGLPDLSAYADKGVDPNEFLKPPDLSAYAVADAGVEEEQGPQFSTQDGLPQPDDPGGIKDLITEVPFSLKEEEKVIKAINAMRQDGYRYIGVDSKGKLIRVISQSDLRQIMGPFFGTKAMSARDKAICTVPLGKLNKEQQLIRLPISGTIDQAADLFMEFGLRALPVVSKQGVLRGFVTVHSVMNYYRKKRRV
jgi:CBS domain-containing protein